MRILSNEDIESVLDMEESIAALYQGIKAYSRGDAARRPRIDLIAPSSRPEEYACFSTMDGIIREKYYALRIKPDIISWPRVNGMKRRVTYCSKPGLYGGLVLLFSTKNAELLAIMNDGFVQHMRVGALAALGAKYLSRQDSETVGMLGSGGMARSFAMGFAAVRPIKKIKAYSPTARNLRAYCGEMSHKLGIEVIPMENAEAAVRGSAIVATCTNSMEAVIQAEWIEPGMYIASVNSLELDKETLRKITLIGRMLDRAPLDVSNFSDDNFEVRMSVMAYVAGQPKEREKIPGGAFQQGEVPAVRVVPCVDWQTEKPLGRQSDEDITGLAELSGGITKQLASNGIQGLQFAAVAGWAYELAVAKGLGKELPKELFLQDIPT